MSEDDKPEVSSRRSSLETVNGLASNHNLLEEERQKVGALKEYSKRKPFWRRFLLTFAIHMSIFLLYSTLALLALDSRYKSLETERNLLYSPANVALKWKLHEFNSGDGHEGPFSGYPRPELEEAWDSLLGHMNVRFSFDDLNQFGRLEDAVQLPDGSGYAGTLNVYHEIHCVKWLHVHLYQEHYYPNADDSQREKNRLHSEHCLNHLRKSAVCHGDVGMVTYKWGNSSLKPLAQATSHQCVDWNSLAEWTNERAIDMFKPGYLVHPTLGPVYREGEAKGLMD